MKVWITKNLLTAGIIEKDAEVCTDTPKMIRSLDPADKWSPYFHKPHWHTSPGEALAQARVMISKKIASVRKQLKSLEHLSEEYNV